MQRLLTLLVIIVVGAIGQHPVLDGVYWRNLPDRAKLAYAIGVQNGVDMAFRLHIHPKCADCDDSEVVREMNALYSSQLNIKVGDAVAYVHMKLSGASKEELRKYLADITSIQ